MNEEVNISDAIRSIKGISDAVVILDAGSNDRTTELAAKEGATVWTRAFDTEHQQRNWFGRQISTEWPGAWILELDADERLTPDLATEIDGLLASGPKHDAYLVTIRFFFDRRLLRFGGFSRTRLPRLRRADAGEYESRDVNPHLMLSDKKRLGRLKGYIVHTDVVSWEPHIEKHNRYSSLEARARYETVAQPASRVATLTAIRAPHLRRRWFRERVWNHLPAKPMLLFLNNYLLLGGWMDGRAGLRNAVFRSWQVMCTDLKYKDLRGEFRFTPASTPVEQDDRAVEDLVVCVLTLNEEKHIVEVIASARAVTNDVIVVDSHSNDATTSLAASSGAQVWTHDFANWGAQRNWALDRIQNEFGDPWVLFLDADERLSPELIEEISRELTAERPRYDAYLIGHTLIFAGRALRWGGFTGTLWARLLRSSAGRHEERAVNDHLILSPGARVSRMKARIIHHDVQNWERYLSKQNRYSTLEAIEVLNRDRGVKSVTLREAVANPPLRRRWLRETIWPKVPAKPVVRFSQIYLLSGGLLDGYAGMCIATMQAWAEMCVELKSEEMGSKVPPALST